MYISVYDKFIKMKWNGFSDLFLYFCVYLLFQGYEARAIGVARRLTNQLKRNLRSISSTASSLPSGVQDSVAKARSFSEDLYHSFTSVSIPSLNPYAAGG